MNRHKLFDQARGIAIVAMVMANSAPGIAEDVSIGFWFRILSSFPAPTFVMVAGVMVAITAPKHNFMYSVWRALFVLGMGALIDVAVNKMVPFQGCDVLYLVGFMTPIAYGASKLKTSHLIALIVGLFAISFGLQSVLEYGELPITLFLSGATSEPGSLPAVWHYWLVDGWFPIFPWVPMGLCGVLFARIYQQGLAAGGHGFARRSFVLPMVALFGIGVALSIIFKSPYFTREGYIELFYPPSVGFVASAVAAVGLILAMCEVTARASFTWFQLFGSMTLAMYALHLMIISYVLTKFFFPVHDLFTFYLIFAGHLMVLTVCAYFIKFARETYAGMPLMLKWLVGK